MSQKDLGASRYSAAYISQIEHGRRNPRPSVVRHIAGRLGVTERELSEGLKPDFEARLELTIEQARSDIFSGRLDTARKQLDRARRQASQSTLIEHAARVEESLALCFERGGDLAQALEHYERALSGWQSSPLPQRAETVSGRARVLELMGDARYAMHILESYLDELDRRGLPDPTARMRTYTTLVHVYFAAGLPRQAIEAGKEAMRLEPLVEDAAQIATMHLNVARALLVDGDVEAALRSLRRAETLRTQLQRKEDAAYAHIARGIVLASENRLDDAKDVLEGALRALGPNPSRLFNARGLTELAKVERLRGNASVASELLDRAIGLLQDSDVFELAMAHRELALCKLGDDPVEAEKHLWRAIELYRQADDAVHQAAVYRLLGDKLRDHGDLTAAIEAYRSGLELVEPRTGA